MRFSGELEPVNILPVADGSLDDLRLKFHSERDQDQSGPPYSKFSNIIHVYLNVLFFSVYQVEKAAQQPRNQDSKIKMEYYCQKVHKIVFIK